MRDRRWHFLFLVFTFVLLCTSVVSANPAGITNVVPKTTPTPDQPQLWVTSRDNPNLFGHMDPVFRGHKITWDSVEHRRPGFHEGSRQTYGGSYSVRLKSTVPVFNHGMKKATRDIGGPIGSVVSTWVPNLLDTADPYINFPPGCEPTVDNCPSERFSWWAQALSLTNAWVRFDMFARTLVPGTGFGGEQSFFESTVIDRAFLRGPRTLPVHVFVFANLAGGNCGDGVWWINGPVGERHTAGVIQQMFDGRYVRFGESATWTDWWGGETWSSVSTDHVETRTNLPNDEDIDQIWEKCGIQVRLASVSFVRQPDRMEGLIDRDLSGRLIDCWDGHTAKLNGVHRFRIGKYIEHFDQTSRSLGSGVNLFVTGPWSDLACNFEPGRPRGIGCPSDGQHLPYAVVAAPSSGKDPVYLTSHELSHVLGSRHQSTPSGVNEVEFFDQEWRTAQRGGLIGGGFVEACERMLARGRAFPHFWQ